MIKRQIDVQIKRGISIKHNKSWFRDMAITVLDAESIADSLEFGLVITDTKTIRRLNKTYREQDKPTDVLAFHMVHNSLEQNSQFFITPPNGVMHLGEVVISYPVAVQQALEHGHSIEKELAILTIHGILHLFGYDHNKDEERRIMNAKERQILNTAGF
jgi:probable rRNA maturation factor